jgi:hypothetical protein
MANDRTSMDEQYTGPERERRSNTDEEDVRGGTRDDVRGIADEEDEEFEDTDDLEEDEDTDGSF